jgi:DNA-binding NarL/FixJ family response regulator
MSEHLMTRVAIVDDHALIRRGIRESLVELGRFHVVAEGASADDAISISRSTPLDVMLVDINMPGGGIEAVKVICSEKPRTHVLMLTIYDNMANVKAALQAGAAGYVLKGIEGDELAAIVDKVNKGAKHVSPELAAKLLLEGDEDASTDTPKARQSKQRFAMLSEREQQIHALIAQGASNLQIGTKLGLKEATVKHYASQIFRKLGVKNRTEAALLLA